MQFSFFLMNKKGLEVLQNFIVTFGTECIDCVISAQDKSVQSDYYDDIKSVCQKAGITFHDRAKNYTLNSEYSFAIGWRWLIYPTNTLIILHDSLLPKYRGFAPLITSLINGDRQIGVTALFAELEYDRGDIIDQRSSQISYPIKIQEAIEVCATLYIQLVQSITETLLHGQELTRTPQDEGLAEYSLWRDEHDYLIDWTKDAADILRFIYAVGFPYQGASSFIKGKKVRIMDALVEEDVNITNRTPGKILQLKEGQPVIVCGRGLLKITQALYDNDQTNLLPVKNLRQRFSSSVTHSP